MAKKPVKKKAAKPVKKPAPKAAKPVKKPAVKASTKKPAPKPPKKAAAAPVKKPAAVAVAKVPPKKAVAAVEAKGKKPVVAKAPKPGKAAPIPAPEKTAKKGKGKPEPEEIPEVSEVVTAEAEEVEEGSEEVVLTDAEGRRYCRVKDCDQVSTVDGYCRYHYLLYWKKIQVRKKILSEGKLERYVEELTARYPDKFLEMLRKDLRSDKEFLAAIQELEIDESATENEFEDETANYIEEVRGMAEPGAREEEDF